eukprot:9253624-Lingulodinium_polyedra.AAC.1
MDGAELTPDTVLYPLVAVAPMGWSWALFLVQRAHEAILDRAKELDPSRRAVDFRPPPDPAEGPIHSLYVDNVLVEGHDADAVTAARQAASAAFRAAGLDVHEETD